MTFDDWYKTLISDEIWFEQSSKRHKLTTFLSVAEKVYTLAIADAHQFSVIPISERRRHVVYLLAKIPADKIVKPWYQQESEKKEVEEKKEWKPVSEEERKKWLDKWKTEIDKFEDNRIKPLLDGQVEEIGQTDPPKPKAKYRPYTPAEFIIDRDIHFKWIEENVNPDLTKKENYMEEAIWRSYHGYPDMLNHEII
jgi:hypothetical protein